MATPNEFPVPNADFPRDNTAPILGQNGDKFPLWPQKSLSEFYWNKYLPYQLLLVKVKQGDTVNIDLTPTITYERLVNTNDDGKAIVFTLPISPQELSIDMPIATNLQATLDGITEIHGGVPFRNISLTGTTGITPLRGRAGQGREGNSSVTGNLIRLGNAIFAGASAAAVRTLNSATATFSVSGLPQQFPNVNQDITGSGRDQIPTHSTGYYQMRLLEKFLENYALIKSKNQVYQEFGGVNSKDIRLAFAVWKEETIYLVSGVQLSKKKSGTDPHLYTFTLQMKAWARISLNNTNGAEFRFQSVVRKPNFLAESFNRLNTARDTFINAREVLEGVVSDPTNTINEAFRRTSLFMKDGLGLAATLIDFPDNIKNRAVPLIVSNWVQLRSQFNLEGQIDSDIDQLMQRDQIAGASSTGILNAPLTSGSNLPQILVNDPSLLNVIFKAIPPTALPNDNTTNQLIQTELANNKNLTRLDFENIRNNVRRLVDSYAFAIGAGNTIYGNTYNLNLSPISPIRSPTLAEFDMLYALNELSINLDKLAASGQTNKTVIPTSIEYVAGLAEKSSIAFQIPQSKYAVPFPYGFTLEKLAEQYLGDANRWHEIATLNGLRDPYIDEIGFSLPLLVNGNGNTVVVGDSTNLFIGQTVYLSATGVNRTKYHILDITLLNTPTFTTSSSNFLILLDANNDLARFTTTGNAQLEAFLPGTVNSRQIIYLPSSVPIGEDSKLKAIPGINEFDPYLKVGGTDLLLTSTGDIAVTPDGSAQLAFGLSNIVQTVKLVLTTPRGSILQHPSYGLDIPIGTSTADVDVKSLLKTIQDYFSNDSTFSGVQSVTVAKDGNTLRITVVAAIQGVSKYIPITLAITS